MEESQSVVGGGGGGVGVSHGVVVMVGPGGEAWLSWSGGVVEVSQGVVGGGVGVSHGVVSLVEVGGEA